MVIRFLSGTRIDLPQLRTFLHRVFKRRDTAAPHYVITGWIWW
jgi:hypothetical protein